MIQSNKIFLTVIFMISLISLTFSFMFFTSGTGMNIEKWYYFIQKFYDIRLFFFGNFVICLLMCTVCIISATIIDNTKKDE